jgi:hypothetical protein
VAWCTKMLLWIFISVLRIRILKHTKIDGAVNDNSNNIKLMNKRELTILRQKKMLKFLERNWLSKQFDKSLGDLTEKMGMQEYDKFKCYGGVLNGKQNLSYWIERWRKYNSFFRQHFLCAYWCNAELKELEERIEKPLKPVLNRVLRLRFVDYILSASSGALFGIMDVFLSKNSANHLWDYYWQWWAKQNNWFCQSLRL